MRSHRFHRLMLIPVIALCVMGLALPNHKDTKTQSQDILVIDFTKKASGNPYQELYEKLLYPTVRIKAGYSTGSGVFIKDYILTAAHVVSDESTVIIETFYPERTEIEATVVITDTIKDLALIKPLEKLPYSAKLAPKEYVPYIFAPVWTVGCSLGLEPRPSFGYITAIPQSEICNPQWEISSPILPGNSGGPVYDAKTYEVIGIAVWVHTHQGQLVTTMAGIVPIKEIYEFLATDYTD